MTDIQAGSLGGVNPSEEDEAQGAKADVDVDAELANLSGQGDDREPEPEADPEPAKKKGSASRPYVVLKEEAFDDGEPYTLKVHEVEARNATNALRKAARELHGKLGDTDSATLIVIPKTMWRPTPVRLDVSERVSVSIG